MGMLTRVLLRRIKESKEIDKLKLKSRKQKRKDRHRSAASLFFVRCNYQGNKGRPEVELSTTLMNELGAKSVSHQVVILINRAAVTFVFLLGSCLSPLLRGCR